MEDVNGADLFAFHDKHVNAGEDGLCPGRAESPRDHSDPTLGLDIAAFREGEGWELFDEPRSGAFDTGMSVEAFVGNDKDTVLGPERGNLSPSPLQVRLAENAEDVRAYQSFDRLCHASRITSARVNAIHPFQVNRGRLTRHILRWPRVER